MRRLLALPLVAAALASTGAGGTAAQATPQCAGAFALGYTVGYCTESVCTDTCVMVAYAMCEQPESSRADVCATWNAVLPDLR